MYPSAYQLAQLYKPPVVVQSGFNPTSYGTVLADWDFSVSAKVLNASGTAAANNENIATVQPNYGSGGNLTQSTDGSRFVCKTNVKNSLQVADGGGSGTWMLAPAGIHKNLGQITIVAVYQIRDANGHVVAQFQSGSDNTFKAYHGAAESNFYSLEGMRSGGSGFSYYGGTASASTWYLGIWKADYTNNTYTIWNATGQVATDSQDGAGVTGNSDAGEGNTIGAGNIYGSGSANWQVGEVIMYSSLTDQSGLATALATKWGALS